MREFLTFLKSGLSNYIKSNPLTSYKYKYHTTHNYNNIYLMRTNNELDVNCLDVLDNYILSILVVSTYFSRRYNLSNNYLNNECSTEMLKHVKITHNIGMNELINEFISNYLSVSEDDTQIIRQKEMSYLWKLFCDMKHIPNLLYYNDLFSNIETKLGIQITDGVFKRINSQYLEKVGRVSQFIECNFENDVSGVSLEVSEALQFFNKWNKRNHRISDSYFLNILTHFYDYKVIDKKHIINVRLTNWNKEQDLYEFLQTGKNTYSEYLTFCNQHQKHIVSRQYFEKYLTATA